MWFKRKQKPLPERSPFDLDTELLWLSEEDPVTIRDACNAIHIYGGIGSGKTSSSGATLARSYLEAGFGGLICTAKPEELKLWQQYAAETGRSDDLIIVSPEHPYCFNFLDYEMNRAGRGAGETENIVDLISTLSKITDNKSQGGGDEGGFWESAAEELIRNAVILLALAKEPISVKGISDIILTAPQSIKEASSEQWKSTAFCAQCILTAALREDKTDAEFHDCQMADQFWRMSFPQMADRTRASVIAHFRAMASALLTGNAYQLLCTDTNIVPEITWVNGAIIVLDMSIQEYRKAGKIIQSIFKFVFQRAVLRRDPEIYPRPVFLWCDEAQNFVTGFDYEYQAVARSARACTVFISQNIDNYHSALGVGSHDNTAALLGLFQMHVFHSNSSSSTNQYAADLIGKEWKDMISVDRRGDGGQDSSHGSSVSKSYEYKVDPDVFARLRNGTPINNLEVDTVIFRGGTPWRQTQDSYLLTTFFQQ